MCQPDQSTAIPTTPCTRLSPGLCFGCFSPPLAPGLFCWSELHPFPETQPVHRLPEASVPPSPAPQSWLGELALCSLDAQVPSSDSHRCLPSPSSGGYRTLWGGFWSPTGRASPECQSPGLYKGDMDQWSPMYGWVGRAVSGPGDPAVEAALPASMEEARTNISPRGMFLL